MRYRLDNKIRKENCNFDEYLYYGRMFPSFEANMICALNTYIKLIKNHNNTQKRTFLYTKGVDKAENI